MIVVERPRRRQSEGVGSYTRQCEVRGCTHSARFDCIIIDTHTLLCRGCMNEWTKAWGNALANWSDEYEATG